MPERQVVARIVVAINAQAIGLRTEAHAVEPRAAGVVMNDVPPAEMISLHRQGGIAVVAFGREAPGVDQERRLFRPAARATGLGFAR